MILGRPLACLLACSVHAIDDEPGAQSMRAGDGWTERKPGLCGWRPVEEAI